MTLTDEMIEAAARIAFPDIYEPDEEGDRSALKIIRDEKRAQLVKEMLAAVLPLLQQDWQPIETAPKGKEVLLFEPAIRTAIRSLSARIVIGSYPTSYPREPTHWLPLPEPPKTKP